MSRHLTHRFWLCFLLGWTGLGAATALRGIQPLALSSPFLAAIAISLLDGWWPAAEVESPRISSPRVVEGDLVEFSVDVVTPRRTWVELELQFPASLVPVDSSRFVGTVDGRRTFSVNLMAAKWGARGPEWAVATSRDVLGMSERAVRVPFHLPVRVHPSAERLSSLLPLARQRAVTGDHRTRAKGTGTEVAEVRPYRQGDPIRMVHPRLSLRRGEPTVVERHPERSSDVALLIDSAQDLGVDLDTTLRWTVTAAMALTERHLRAQDRVGLIDLGYGVRWLPPSLGRKHLHVVVDALLATEIVTSGEQPATALPATRLPKAATIIAISPLVNKTVLRSLAELRSRGHQIVVLQPSLPAPDPDVRPLARRLFRIGNEINERWLRQRGVVVIPWSTGDSLEHLISRVAQTIGRAHRRG